MAERAPYDGKLMFTQSWEDPACDRTAVEIQPGDHVLAVTSGGDNILEFLCDDPAKIIAVDINPAQTWLFELKRAAFNRLDHQTMLDLLGVGNRLVAAEIYREVRTDLSPQARAFFNDRIDWFNAGLLTQGGFERYFAILSRIIALAVGRRNMETLFTLSPDQQQDFYRNNWNGWRWRTLIRFGCSKWLLGNRLDPSWFRSSDNADFGGHFLKLAEHVLTRIPTRDNYFLAQMFFGRYLAGSVPAYLRAENFATIRDRINRIEPRTADIGDALRALPPRSIDVFALSNVFEYSPVALFDAGKDEILRVARPGARLALRNLLAPRRLADDPRFIVDVDLSERLRMNDRGFIYSRFEAARLA